MMITKEEIMKVAENSYFINAAMIKFLLVENLALKTIVHDKGLIDSEEFKKYQQKAAEILEAKTASQITEQFQQLLERNQHGSSDV